MTDLAVLFGLAGGVAALSGLVFSQAERRRGGEPLSAFHVAVLVGLAAMMIGLVFDSITEASSVERLRSLDTRVAELQRQIENLQGKG